MTIAPPRDEELCAWWMQAVETRAPGQEIFESADWTAGCYRVRRVRRTLAQWLCHQAFRRIARHPYGHRRTRGGQKSGTGAWKRAGRLWFELCVKRPNDRYV